jgi:type VI secretion system secreted protein Hcp
MPVPGYLSVTGSVQGNITSGAGSTTSIGGLAQSGHADQSLIEAATTQVVIPCDPQSGAPTGTRVHQPSTITKIFDKASPLLWQALCTGESLTIELDFYRISTTGTQEKYFTINWTNAVLVDGKGYMPNCLDPNFANYNNMETWAFTYQAITWTNVACGTSGSDSWASPNQS